MNDQFVHSLLMATMNDQQEYHESLRKYHCRYTQLHPGSIHRHETYGIYITAESEEEAEAILRKLRPKALQVWVYEGVQVYAHKQKTTWFALDYKPTNELDKLQDALERAMKYHPDETEVLAYLKAFIDNYQVLRAKEATVVV